MTVTMIRRFLILLILVVSVLPLVLGQTVASQSGLSPHVVSSKQSSPAFYLNDPGPLNGSVTTNGFDLAPTALVTTDGNFWVAWASNRAGTFQVYYQVYNGIVWSLPAVVTTGGFNTAPSLVQLLNGTVVLVWAGGTSGNDNHLYYRTNTNGIWGSTFPLTSGSTIVDELPKAVVTLDSTLWVFFERDNNTVTPQSRQIYYKTLKGNTWSADKVLTTGTVANQQPSATVIKGGSILVSWAKNNTTSGNSTVYERSYNGTAWSTTDTALTGQGPISTPNIVQDRNGTLWLTWSQVVQLNATRTENMVLYRTSTDVGKTWSPTANMTNWGSSLNPINNYSPFGIQGVDTTLYFFFATDVAEPFGSGVHIYYVQSSGIYPIHDVGITSVTVSPSKNYPYGTSPTSIATISVTVKNYGDQNETVVVVSVQASNTTTYKLTNQTGFILASLSKVFTFQWNVTKSGAQPGRYTLNITVPPVPGETPGNSLDNTLKIKSGVIILYAGDVNHDGVVNVSDIIIMLHHWAATKGSANYLPDADLNRNGVIDTGDVIVALHNYYKSI